MTGADPLDRLQSLWVQHRRWLLPALLTLMTIAATLKLEYQFRRLVWEAAPNGAIDLQQLQRSVGESTGSRASWHLLEERPRHKS